MIKIGLCDDNLFYIKELSKILKNISLSSNIDIEITTFESGEKLLDFCFSHKNYFDILFLDILMDGINGISTAEEIRKFNSDIYIIFISSSKDYALDSYNVNAYSYILKPFTLETIKAKVLDLKEKFLSSKNNIIYVKNNHDIYTLNLNEVVYFESNLRKIVAHMRNGDKISFYNKMSNLEDDINNTMFLRCHRSFLVNLLYVKNIVGSDLTTTTKSMLPISKKYLNTTRDSFTEYIKVKLSS